MHSTHAVPTNVYLGSRFTPSPFASSRPPLGLIILTGLELDLPLGRVKLPPGGLALPLALTHPHLAQRLLLHLKDSFTSLCFVVSPLHFTVFHFTVFHLLPYTVFRLLLYTRIV